MKITRVEPCLFDAGLRRVWCFVRVETDQGLTGWGEATTTEPFMAAAVVRRMAEWLAGEDAGRIQYLWQAMYRRYYNVRGGNLLLAAMSGVEHALWDLKGKAAGLPVYELLGGACRVRVPVYVNHMFFPRSADPDAPERYAERAVEAVERGYRALKIDPFGDSRDTLGRAELRRACAIARAVRDAVGPEVDLAIDSHARFAVEGAIRAARAMQEFDPFFFEEPVPPENVAALRKVRDAVDVPIATGERLYTRWGFRELLEAQAAEIVQVDVAHCGGILEARFIAALAETHYVQVAPHSWYGPVSLAASLHLDATIPNLLIQETPVPHEMPAQQRDLLTTPLTPQAGTLAVPAAPGLGVAIDEGVLKRHRVPG